MCSPLCFYCGERAGALRAPCVLVDAGAALEIMVGLACAGVDIVTVEGGLTEQSHTAVVGVDECGLGCLIQTAAAACAGDACFFEAFAGVEHAVVGEVHCVVIGAGHGIKAQILEVLKHVGLGEDISAAAIGIGKAGIVYDGCFEVGKADVAALEKIAYLLELGGIGQMIADHAVACCNKRNHTFLSFYHICNIMYY